MNENRKQREELVQEIAKGGVTVLTGAGVSTDSGLPDFRGRDGLWTGSVSLLELLTAEGASQHPEEFTAFCKQALARIEAGKPNRAHEILDQALRSGVIDYIITQNVDGYHHEASADLPAKQRAELGERILPLHGSMRQIVCAACRKPSSIEAFKADERCACGGHLRPDIVLFGESLRSDVLDQAIAALEETRLLILIGSTLKVEPVSLAPRLVKDRGGKFAVINENETAWDADADFILRGDIATILEELWMVGRNL